MEVTLNESAGVVEVWLTRQDQDSLPVQRELQALLARCRGKYRVAVYRSGSESLLENTSWLLCSNQKRLAQQP